MSKVPIQHFEELEETEQDRLLQAVHTRWEIAKEVNYRYGAPMLLAELRVYYPPARRLSLEAFKEAMRAAGFRWHNGSDEWAFAYLRKKQR